MSKKSSGSLSNSSGRKKRSSGSKNASTDSDASSKKNSVDNRMRKNVNNKTSLETTSDSKLKIASYAASSASPSSSPAKAAKTHHPASTLSTSLKRIAIIKCES